MAETDDIVALIDGTRIHVAKLSIGCCTCGVKTFQPEWHDANCPVRSVAEALDNLDSIATALTDQDAQIERLTRELAEASADVETMLAEANVLTARATTAERDLAEARAEVERVKGLLWYSWHEFNAIKARHGAPVDHYLMLTVDPEYWGQLTEAFAAAIGPEDAKPWPSTRARAALQQSEVKP